jgi:transposase
VATALAAGGSVWCADETTLREFPPLRAAWARRGEQAVVTISGRNARRVLHGALNIVTGELVRVVREHSRGADSVALVAALAARTPAGRSVLVWDNAPPHHTRLARETAEAVGIALVPLPYRSPELMPCEAGALWAAWRELKRVVAANRAYTDVDELAGRAVGWLDDCGPAALLRLAGLQSSKFDWLPT